MKITESLLKKLIREEKNNLLETLELGLDRPEKSAKKTRTVDAKDMAKTLEQCVDYYKTCCIKESELKKELRTINEMKRSLKQKMKQLID